MDLLSGWHGWVYGWKLHLAVTVGAVWIPLAARLTPANTADNKVAPLLIEALAKEARFVLGDTHYDDNDLREACLKDGRFLILQRTLHKAIFDVHGPVPTKGKTNTARFALGAVFVYQLSLLYRYEQGLRTNVGMKPFLRAA